MQGLLVFVGGNVLQNQSHRILARLTSREEQHTYRIPHGQSTARHTLLVPLRPSARTVCPVMPAHMESAAVQHWLVSAPPPGDKHSVTTAPAAPSYLSTSEPVPNHFPAGNVQ